MKLSLAWLREFVEVKESPEEVAKVFTSLGFEVERIETYGEKLQELVVAKIISIRPHPQADKLRLATVTDGQKEYEVVCGAPNIEVGQRVPLVLSGQTLPSGDTIEKATIRGVESNGMLCSPAELGLSDDHSGILIIDPAVKPGTSLAEALGLPDHVLDLTVSPNRPDALSMLGLAREFAAKTNRRLRQLEPVKAKESSPNTSQLIHVKVADRKACPAYTARLVTDVRIGPSPFWVQKKLSASGVRPINSIVDITNLVMLETGQPMHAFDADRIQSLHDRITLEVRSAKDGEKLQLLDGKTVTLKPTVTVIADGQQVLAIAGVMGGQASQVTAETKRVIFESALFTPAAVRIGRQLIQTRTESSMRFERGLSLGQTIQAVDRAAGYAEEFSGGRVSRGSVQVLAVRANRQHKVKVEPLQIQKLLGVKLSHGEMKQLLRRLGFIIQPGRQQSVFHVLVPEWRHDIEHQADLAEEIGRLRGYDSIVGQPLIGQLNAAAVDPSLIVSRLARQLALSAGFSELYTYSFYGENAVRVSGRSAEQHYRVANPLDAEQAFLRASLIPGLLFKLRKNQALGAELRLFEIGHIFRSGEAIEEPTTLGAVVMSHAEPQTLFSELKGVAEALIQQLLGRQAIEVVSDTPSRFRLRCHSTDIGFLRLITQTEAQELKLSGTVAAMELQLSVLTGLPSRRQTFQAIQQFPAVTRDISLDVSEELSYAELEKIILAHATDSMQLSISPLGEVYRSDELRDVHKKNLVIRIRCQSPERTLTTGEVDELVGRVIRELKKSAGADIKE